MACAFDPEPVHAELWSRLQHAAGDPRHPWHWPALATTATDGMPSVRTVVLRQVDPAVRVISFHTDLRSPKVSMIRLNRRVAFCFNDGFDQVQLRVFGEAEVRTAGTDVDHAWRSLPPTTRAAYAQLEAPGTTIDRWKPRPSASDDAGRQNFAVVRCVIREIDWLKLDPAGHYRIRFTYGGDGSLGWAWLAP